MNEETLFHLALQKPAAERAAFLNEACAGEAAVRQRLEVLLRAHEDRGNPLDHPPVDLALTTDPNEPNLAPDPTPGFLPDAKAAGPRIGPYKLLKPLGEGGMGTVYLAEQERPVKRYVALKIIKAGMDSGQVIARFEQERQALAVMDHPNIAKVLEAGTTDAGRPYFVMELVQGIPITKYCDQEHLTPKERLELFIPVCQAVQHAHQKGIIHRDLKPSNVLVALYDGKPIPKVIDFGVAKATAQKMTERTMFTEVGQILGTLEYMAPEQAELTNLDIDTRADIYSLGVILYELLTGSPPFTSKQLRGAAFTEMLRVIREVEPSKPSTKLSSSDQLPSIAANRKLDPKKLTKQVQGELDWIVLKCLEKERVRRYETANGLATDVQRYLANEPVLAGPPSQWYRLSKFMRRNKRVLASVTAVILMVVTVLAVSNVQIRGVLQERDRAYFDLEAQERDTKRALAHESEALTRERTALKDKSTALDRERYSLAVNRNLRAHHALLENKTSLAESLLDQCPTEFRQWEWDHLKRACAGPLIRIQAPAPVKALTFSPDGNVAAFTWSSKEPSWIRFHDAATGGTLSAIKGPVSGFLSLAYSHDGRRFAAGDGDGTVHVWDAATKRSLRVFPPAPDACLVTGVAFAAEGNLLAATYAGKLPALAAPGTLKVWNVETGREHISIQEKYVLTSVAFPSRPGASLLATSGGSGEVKVREAITGRIVAQWKPDIPMGAVTCLQFQDYVLAGLIGTPILRNVRCWQLPTYKPAEAPKSDDDPPPRLLERATFFSQLGVEHVAFRPYGGLAFGARDGTVRFQTGYRYESEEQMVCAHREAVSALAFSSNGRRLATASGGEVKIWDSATCGDSLFMPAGPFPRGAAGAGGISVSADRRFLAWCSLPHVHVRDLTTGRLRLSHFAARCVTLHPKHHLAALGLQEDNAVQVVDFSEDQVQTLATLAGHSGLPYQILFSPDGERLASVGLDKMVRVWNWASGKVLFAKTVDAPLLMHLCRLAFSPDGKWLALGAGDKTVHLLDAFDGTEISSFTDPNPSPTRDLTSLAFSPDGLVLASGHNDGTVNLWDTHKGTLVRALHQGTFVSSIVFAPDGKRLVTSGPGLTFWDPKTGEEVLNLKSLTIHSMTFSQDGKWLVAAELPDGVRIWSASKREDDPPWPVQWQVLNPGSVKNHQKEKQSDN